MNTDSERGVWFPPRPLEGGTPTSRVGGVLEVAMEAASSEEMMDSTSSMQISTFSGFRSTDLDFRMVIRGRRAIMKRIVPVWITPQHRCM